jgi:hypothetical protein
MSGIFIAGRGGPALVLQVNTIAQLVTLQARRGRQANGGIE